MEHELGLNTEIQHQGEAGPPISVQISNSDVLLKGPKLAFRLRAKRLWNYETGFAAFSAPEVSKYGFDQNFERVFLFDLQSFSLCFEEPDKLAEHLLGAVDRICSKWNETQGGPARLNSRHPVNCGYTLRQLGVGKGTSLVKTKIMMSLSTYSSTLAFQGDSRARMTPEDVQVTIKFLSNVNAKDKADASRLIKDDETGHLLGYDGKSSPFTASKTI